NIVSMSIFHMVTMTMSKEISTLSHTQIMCLNLPMKQSAILHMKKMGKPWLPFTDSAMKTVSSIRIKRKSMKWWISIFHIILPCCMGVFHQNTEHDHYAPFHLTDLTHNKFDYWALGHIHNRQVLHTDH